MITKEKDLYYFPKEKTFIWIIGYTQIDHPNVVEVVKELLKYTYEFIGITGCEMGDVKVDFIRESNRFKNMHIMYCDMEEKDIPKDTHVIKTITHWWQWLK